MFSGAKNKYHALFWLVPILLLVVLGVFLLKSSFFSEEQNASSEVSGEPPLSFGQITREERLNHIEWVYSQGDTYDELDLENQNLAVTFYQWKSQEQSERKGGAVSI